MSSDDYLSPAQLPALAQICLCKFACSVALSCLLKHRADQWPLLVESLCQPHWLSPAMYFLTCSLGMSYSFSSPPCFLPLSLRLSLKSYYQESLVFFFLLFSFRLLILYPQSMFLDAYYLVVVNYDCNYLLEINSIDVYVCVCLGVCMCTMCVQLPEAARRGYWMLWSWSGRWLWVTWRDAVGIALKVERSLQAIQCLPLQRMQSQAWWYTPILPALGRPSSSALAWGYTVSCSVRKQQNTEEAELFVTNLESVFVKS